MTMKTILNVTLDEAIGKIDVASHIHDNTTVAATQRLIAVLINHFATIYSVDPHEYWRETEKAVIAAQTPGISGPMRIQKLS